MKKLIMDEFFDDKNAYVRLSEPGYSEGVGAVGIITPNQMVEVWNIPEYECNFDKEKKDGLGYHNQTSFEILSKLYDVHFDSNNYSENFQTLNKIIPNGDDNFVYIRYVNYLSDYNVEKKAMITTPSIVTPYQLEMIGEKVWNIIKTNKGKENLIYMGFCVGNYNPINHERNYDLQTLHSENVSPLLSNFCEFGNFLYKHNRIIDYVISDIPKELIFEYESGEKNRKVRSK